MMDIQSASSDTSLGLTILPIQDNILPQLCGPHDSYIRYLERSLDTRLVVRGNCIYVDSDKPALKQQLQRVIESLEKYIENGCSINEKIIDTVISDKSNNSNNLLRYLQSQRIEIGGGKVYIEPHTINQARYLDALKRHEIVIVIGPAGSGKTYLAVAYAVARLLKKQIHKIIVVRPVVEAGEHLGFLPGDLEQKLNPYMQPVYDVLRSFLTAKEIENLHQKRAIEVIPLAYMRGRSLVNSCVVLDEAQNTTVGQIKMLLTRVGRDSQVVVTGDITQIDLPSSVNSGLIRAMKVLDNIKEIAIIRLNKEDIVRNPLLCHIIEAFSSAR